MNKVYTLLILAVSTLLVLAFLPIINGIIDDTLLLENTDTIAPIFGEPTPYIVETEFEPVSIISIDNAHGWVPESQYNLEDGVLTILSTDAPLFTYDLDILYMYEDLETTAYSTVLRFIPFLIAVVAVGFYLKFGGGK